MMQEETKKVIRKSLPYVLGFLALPLSFIVGILYCYLEPSVAYEIEKFQEGRLKGSHLNSEGVNDTECLHPGIENNICIRGEKIRQFGGCPVRQSQWEIEGKRWYEMDKQEFKEEMKELGFESMDEFWDFQHHCNDELKRAWLLRSGVKRWGGISQLRYW